MENVLNGFKAPVIAALVVSLAACGGGGGDGDDALYDGPTDPVVLTDKATADAMTSAAMEAIEADFATPVLKSGSSVGTQGAAKAVSTLALQDLSWYQGSDTLVGATTTEPCDEGSKTISSSGDGTAGSTASITYDSCVYGYLRASGKVSVRVVAGDATTPNYTMDFTVSRFKIEDLDVSGAPTGDYLLTHGGFRDTESLAGDVRTWSFSGSSLYSEDSYAGTLTKTLLEAFNQTYTYNNTTYELTVNTDMTVSSTLIGGKLVVDTTQTFARPSGYYTPQSGQLTITAANNAKVRLTAIPVDMVRIEYDISPIDGTYEETVEKTWDQL